MPVLAAAKTTPISLPVGQVIKITGIGEWDFIAMNSQGGQIDSGSYINDDVIGVYPVDAFIEITTAFNSSLLYASEVVETSTDGAIQKSIVTAKGDILVAVASDTVERLGIGADGDVLTADQTRSTGVKWAPVPDDVDTIQSLTTAGSATAWGSVVLLNSASAITVTLPAASVADVGKTIVVRNIGAGAGTVAAGANSVNGSLNVASGLAITYEATAVGFAVAVSDIGAVPVPVNDQSSVGYIDIGGMRQAWGKTLSTDDDAQTISFGVTFAEPPVVVATTDVGSATSAAYGGAVKTITNATFLYNRDDGIFNADNAYINWLAVGRKP